MQLPGGGLVLFSSFLAKFFGYGGDGVQLPVDKNSTTTRDPNQCTNATEIIEFIFRILDPKYYNRHKVPGNDAVTVRVEMWLQEVTSVSEITQDFEIGKFEVKFHTY